MTTDTPKRRPGRPPVAPEDRKTKPQRSIRLSEAHWTELRRRGTAALEAWLTKPHR